MPISYGEGSNSARIRSARKTDLSGIFGVEDDSFSQPYPHELIAKLLRDCSGGFLVAECFPKIVGYCVAAEKGVSAHLISIAVLSEYRRRGVATELLRGLLASLSSSVRELRLEVKLDNAGAIAFYEEIGFREIDSVPMYYGDGSTAVRMLLTLDETQHRRLWGESK